MTSKDPYLEILTKELVPALGCTEPIAIAYAAAKAREILEAFPDELIVACSGNIIKNVKSVIVPGTKNMKGIETAAILGVVVGDSNKKLEVLSDVQEKDIELTKILISKNKCKVILEKGVENLYIKVIAIKDNNSAEVIIADQHTNIISIKKNNKMIFNKKEESELIEEGESKDFMTVKSIYDYILAVDVLTLNQLLDRQIKMNTNIAEEGMSKPFGANVGKTLLKAYGNHVDNMAKVYAVAGADARMGGCSLPVIINSGSGNQGLTASLPVIVYAKHLEVSEDMLYRALALSNLISIHIKSCIGKLSAFCGAVSAACGSGAAIAYLNGASFDVISNTITNILANTSGIICDGAKASCAAKVASAVDAAIMGYHIAEDGYSFGSGDGIVKENIEKTIRSVCRVAKEGMKETDIEILNIMIE